MFFYTKDEKFNVIASLQSLETGVLLLSQPTAPLNPEYRRWDEWSAAVARAMETGGTIHVTIEREAGRPPLNGWRGPLDSAPEPHKAATVAALDFFAARHGRAYDRETVEVIGLDGAPLNKTDR